MTEVYHTLRIHVETYEARYIVRNEGKPDCAHRLIPVPTRARLLIEDETVYATFVCAYCARLLLQPLGKPIEPTAWTQRDE